MFTGYHADYHALTDEPQYVGFTKLATLSRFALEGVSIRVLHSAEDDRSL
jgi:hypothetical protein